MKPNILFVLLLMTLFTFTRCSKIVIAIDPTEAILGKWENIEIGNWPNMHQISEPSSYREYLPDSIMREYAYESGKFYYQKYAIDTLLYEYVSTPNEDRPQLVIKYTYQFLDNRNKLRLDYFNISSSFSTLIFKRIN